MIDNSPHRIPSRSSSEYIETKQSIVLTEEEAKFPVNGKTRMRSFGGQLVLKAQNSISSFKNKTGSFKRTIASGSMKKKIPIPVNITQIFSEDKIKKGDQSLNVLMTAQDRLEQAEIEMLQKERAFGGSNETVQMVDKLGRTVFHKCCLDQNPRILRLNIEKLRATASNADEFEELLNHYINMKDFYNNTPLLLACIYDYEAKKLDRQKTIDLLLQNGADPNCQNLYTGFTPMHWEARYGKVDSIRAFVERGAIEYIPDERGYRPIDYAGKFRHYKAIQILQTTSMNKIMLKKNGKEKQALSLIMKFSQGKIKNSTFNPFEHEELMHSPVYQTSLLYWACFLPEEFQSIPDIRKILENLEAYPEGPVKIEREKTALHAAAGHGDYRVLNILIKDIEQRKNATQKAGKSLLQGFFSKQVSPTNSQQDPMASYFKKYVPNFNIQYKKLLKMNQLRKTRETYENFNEQLLQYFDESRKSLLTQNQKQFQFDFIDQDGQTPLHMACQNDKEKCAKILIFDHGCNINVSDDFGLRPRDLVQFESIKNLMEKYFKRVDMKFSDNQQNLIEQAAEDELREQEAGFASFREETVDTGPTYTKEQLREKIKEEQEMCYDNLIKFYKTDKGLEEKVKDVLKSRKTLPESTQFAFKVKISNTNQIDKSNHKARLNYFIKALKESNFEVKMFPAHDDPLHMFYITLNFTQETLEKNAEEMQHQMKLVNYPIKYKYLKIFKDKYEPFRSKDKQEIIKKIIQKMAGLAELKEKNIIMNTFQVHSMNEQNDIEDKFRNVTTWELMKQMLTESPKREYTQLIAIKNYFGEKIAFEYGFLTFYTCWLIYPALAGLIVQGQQLYHRENHGTEATDGGLWAFMYATFVSIWISVFIERWRRKENELRLFFGTLVQSNITLDETRYEFLGNEQFSHENHQVDRIDNKRIGTRFFILNLAIQAFFLFLTGLIFYETELYREKLKEYAGILNGIAVSLVNFMFTEAAVPLEDLQNNKREEEYIRSFTLKVFIFKFVNTHMSLIYTIYTASQGKDQAKSAQYELNVLLVGMMIQKMVQIYCTQFGVYYLKSKAFKKLYYKKIQEIGTKQRNQQSKFLSKLDETDKSKIDRFMAERKKMHLYDYLKQDEESKENYEWKRLVTVFNRQDDKDNCIYDSQLLIDEVELNSTLVQLTLVQQINVQSDQFIFLSFATLYSALCPIIAALVLVNNIIVAKLLRKTDLYWQKRSPIVKQNGLGPWITIIEFLAYLTVISNCIFMYWFHNVYAEQVTSLFNINLRHQDDSIYDESQAHFNALEEIQDLNSKDIEKIQFRYSKPQLIDQIQAQILVSKVDGHLVQMLIIMVVFEHLILLVKAMTHMLIGDKPEWVIKQEIQIQYEIDGLSILEKNNEAPKEIRKLNRQIKAQKATYEKIINEIKTTYGMIQDDRERRYLTKKEHDEENQQVTQLDQQKTSRPSMLELNYKQFDSKDRQQNAFSELRFANMINQKLKLGTENQSALDTVLETQMQNRLFRQTFTTIEMQILQTRLQRLCDSGKKNLLISCCNCIRHFAIFQCHDCGNDFFCESCFIENHQTELHKNHRRTSLLPDLRRRSILPPQAEASLDPYDYTDRKKWQKFEQFFFPISPLNEFHVQLRKYFSWMKNSYILLNFIDDHTKKLDFIQALVDFNYDLLGSHRRDDLLKALKEKCSGKYLQFLEVMVDEQSGDAYNQHNTLRGTQFFNSEELLFLNRAAFNMLTERGCAVKFRDFLEQLKLVQDGTFEERVDFLLDTTLLGYKNRKNFVEIQSLINTVMCSMPQDIQDGQKANEILREELTSLEKGLKRQYTLIQNEVNQKQPNFLPRDQLKRIIMKDGEVNKIFKCVLQL